jgi:hypothetical protein
MRDACHLDGERGDRDGSLCQRLDVESRGREAGFIVEPVEPSRESLRADDADATRRVLPAEIVAKSHQIDEMVGVEVADDDCVEATRVDRRRKPCERSLAQIEQDAGIAEPDQVGRARRTWSVGIRRPGTDHIELDQGAQVPPSFAGPAGFTAGTEGSALGRSVRWVGDGPLPRD